MKITSKVTNTIKYQVLKKPLTLKKRHDFCASKHPKLTLIMLHGISSSAEAYSHALTHLEKNHNLDDVRFITLDWLGHGKSHKGKNLEYTIQEQNKALNATIKSLRIDTPIVLVGHSMGTILAAHFNNKYPKVAQGMILLSTPIYTPEDLKTKELEEGMKAFIATVSKYDPKMAKTRAFTACIDNIVKNPKTYDTFLNISVPTTILYGDQDPFIAPKNIREVAKANKNIKAIKTEGKHHISRDKYYKMDEIIEQFLKK